MEKVSMETAIQLIMRTIRSGKEEKLNIYMNYSTLENWIKEGFIKDYEYTGERK